MASAPTLNGTTFYPSDIAIEVQRVGVSFQALDGTRRTAYRASKRNITMEWKQVSLTILNQLRVIAALTTTFTFVDENSTSMTVFCPSGETALKSNVAAILPDNSVEYDATLTLWEA
jgi:hypothetical protein